MGQGGSGATCGVLRSAFNQHHAGRGINVLINVSVRSEMSKYVFDIIRSGSAASGKPSWFRVFIL